MVKVFSFGTPRKGYSRDALNCPHSIYKNHSALNDDPKERGQCTRMPEFFEITGDNEIVDNSPILVASDALKTS